LAAVGVLAAGFDAEGGAGRALPRPRNRWLKLTFISFQTIALRKQAG
jgi:hypothetical protein